MSTYIYIYLLHMCTYNVIYVNRILFRVSFCKTELPLRNWHSVLYYKNAQINYYPWILDVISVPICFYVELDDVNRSFIRIFVYLLEIYLKSLTSALYHPIFSNNHDIFYDTCLFLLYFLTVKWYTFDLYCFSKYNVTIVERPF